MALSPNYGWTEPDNTGLVKNGAQDMRTLGDAIDTSVWNVGFGQAGKNKIINGDFGIWQRGTSFNTTGLFFGPDRFKTFSYSGSSSTISRQAFTPGAAPVAGYEAQFFCRISSTNTQNILLQNIEDVRTFANQTITVSFWAKSASATTVSVGAEQNFGSGGSASVFPSLGSNSVTTSWARYSVTATIPSVTGKTIGTSSYLQINLTSPLLNNNLDIWGVQLERGSKATPFQTASGGSPQAELAMCQRYYFRAQSNVTGYPTYAFGQCIGAGQSYVTMNFPVTMRIAPTALETSGAVADYLLTNSTYSVIQSTGIVFVNASARAGTISVTVASGLVAGNATVLLPNNTVNSYLAWSAEL
jgi:hypothetical protein